MINRIVSFAALLGMGLLTPLMADSLIYNSIPAPLPPNVSSIGYQATGTGEFGDLIQFAPGLRTLGSINVLLSNWAVASAFGSSDPTFSHPLTFSLYNVNNSGPQPQPGSLIATQTQTFAIPWRPEADPTCGGGAWRAGDGNCYNGMAVTVTFDFTGTVVPDSLIYGLAFNTQSYGASPTGVNGPYNSLNFGFLEGAVTAVPSVGSRPLPDTAYWNTVFASNYSDGGAGGTGTFRQDTNWSPFAAAVSFTATPEPGTILLVSLGIAGLAFRRKLASRA